MKDVYSDIKKIGSDLYNHIDILQGCTKKEAVDIVLYGNIIFEKEKEEQYKNFFFNIIYNIAFRKDMTLSEKWQIYWILTWNMFIDNKLKLDTQFERITKERYQQPEKTTLLFLYRSIFEEVFDLIDYSSLYFRKPSERNNNLVVIITNQLLSLQHAPTQRVMDYAYTIQKKIGKRVIIVNAAGMHYHDNNNWELSCTFAFEEAYNNINRLEYKDDTFEFIQNSNEMPNISVLQLMVEMIYRLNPLFVFDIGASSLLTDLCTPFVTTMSLPCSCDYPISCSKYLLVGRKIRSQDFNFINKLEYQKIIETTYNYNYRESSISYNVKEYGIPENAFVLVVIGNRLEKEIDNSFLESIKKTLGIKKNNEEDGKKIIITVVGRYDNKESFLNSILPDNRDQVFFVGNISDASEFTRHADLYLNPDRSGGGRSSYDCLHFGIPVVTLNRGDVFHTCGEDFGVDNWSAYFEVIRKYYFDKEFYKSQSLKAKKRALELEDIGGTISKVFNSVLEMEG